MEAPENGWKVIFHVKKDDDAGYLSGVIIVSMTTKFGFALLSCVTLLIEVHPVQFSLFDKG